jgi:hypothetical protein
MKAIFTKYHGCTESRGARVSARDTDGNRVSVPYEHATNHTNAHVLAAQALCKKMNWNGYATSSHTKEGMVFIFDDMYSRHELGSVSDNAPQLSALLAIDWARLERMLANDAMRTGIPIEVDSTSTSEGVIIEGKNHSVMRVIGILADHGENVLRWVV